jgi:hypothetical protein
MADNTDEEHLDNPINNQSENPPDEIIPTTDTETINSIQETENMEVHHHAHDPAAPHHKKNWKSYFWEFLMLFLAVFCGFLAEYQLEHKIEKDREKQFMRSMINDLQNDLTNMKTTLSVKKQEVQIADSIFLLFSSPDVNNRLKHIYYYGRMFSATYHIFNMTDGTLTQLKNAGGFRLINRRSIVDSILSYNNLYQQFKEDEDLYYSRQLEDYRAIMTKVFDVNIFNTMISEETGKIMMPSGNPPLFNTSKELINELLMRVHLGRRNTINIIKNDLSKLETKAGVLIELIKKEYHLN